MIDMMDKGITPVQGGMLDQSAWFASAVSFLRAEDAKVLEEVTQ